VTLLQATDAGNRPSHNYCARSYRGEPGVLLSYEGLDPQAAYEVKLTYVGMRGRTAPLQRLEANGRPVHPDLEVPAGAARHFTFPIPCQSYPFGRLDLEWLPATSGGNGGTAVAEVWLIRRPPAAEDGARSGQ
jgi:hypothetical protein